MSGGEAMVVLELLWALVWLVVGIVSLAVAVQERGCGSTWRWALPGVGGILFTLGGLFLLWWWAT